MALEGLTPPASGRMGGVGGGAVLAEGVKGLMSGVVDDTVGMAGGALGLPHPDGSTAVAPVSQTCWCLNRTKG